MSVSIVGQTKSKKNSVEIFYLISSDNSSKISQYSEEAEGYREHRSYPRSDVEEEVYSVFPLPIRSGTRDVQLAFS